MQWDHKYDSLLSLIFILCCLPIFNSQNPNILPAMNFSSETKMYHKVNLGSRLNLLLMRCLMSFFIMRLTFMTMEIINVGGPDNALWASECHFSKNEFQHEKKSWEIIFKV